MMVRLISTRIPQGFRQGRGAAFKFENPPCFEGASVENWKMVEIEVYAAGVRSPDKMLGLALELDVIPGLRYKVDTDHDIIYMEFVGEVPLLSTFEAIFSKLGLALKFVGRLPEEMNSCKKTQRIF